MLLARNLTRSIDDRVVWSGLDLEIKAGERIALRGPSGSGKTLLMRTLAGLDRPDEGEIIFRDRPLADWDIPEYRRRVRYLPQEAAFPFGTVRENIALFFSFKANRHLKQDESPLNSWLKTLQLSHRFLDKPVEHLSGGEKQLSALLRTLLLNPGILLLDEPTSNMDDVMTAHVEQLIEEWLENYKDRSLIWTSHDSGQLDRVTRSSLTLPLPNETPSSE